MYCTSEAVHQRRFLAQSAQNPSTGRLITHGRSGRDTHGLGILCSLAGFVSARAQMQRVIQHSSEASMKCRSRCGDVAQSCTPRSYPKGGLTPRLVPQMCVGAFPVRLPSSSQCLRGAAVSANRASNHTSFRARQQLRVSARRDYDVDIKDRLLSALPYLIPLFDGLKYGAHRTGVCICRLECEVLWEARQLTRSACLQGSSYSCSIPPLRDCWRPWILWSDSTIRYRLLGALALAVSL